MAKRAKPNGDTKNHLFTMRLSDKEKEQFDRIAKQKGTTKANLVRITLDFMGLNLFDLDCDDEKEREDHR